MTATLRTRALKRIVMARDGRAAGLRIKRFSAAQEADLLACVASVPDEDILGWRDTGPAILAWIRTHQPMTPPPATTTFGEVIKRTGWRVELFWNGSGCWFTARMISPWDRDGNATYPGGFLAPFDNPLGASGTTPEEAVANLAEAVLEWA